MFAGIPPTPFIPPLTPQPSPQPAVRFSVALAYPTETARPIGRLTWGHNHRPVESFDLPRGTIPTRITPNLYYRMAVLDD